MSANPWNASLGIQFAFQLSDFRFGILICYTQVLKGGTGPFVSALDCRSF